MVLRFFLLYVVNCGCSTCLFIWMCVIVFHVACLMFEVVLGVVMDVQLWLVGPVSYLCCLAGCWMFLYGVCCTFVVCIVLLF